MVVATETLRSQFALAITGSTELTSPDDEGVIEQTPALQIDHQRRRCLIRFATLGTQGAR